MELFVKILIKHRRWAKFSFLKINHFTVSKRRQVINWHQQLCVRQRIHHGVFLTCIILLPLWVKKIKHNCFIHTHTLQHNKEVMVRTLKRTHANINSACARPCSYLLQQVPNHQEALSPEHLLLHGHGALQQLHQERQQGGAARHALLHTTRASVAINKPFRQVPLLRLFIYITERMYFGLRSSSTRKLKKCVTAADMWRWRLISNCIKAHVIRARIRMISKREQHRLVPVSSRRCRGKSQNSPFTLTPRVFYH